MSIRCSSQHARTSASRLRSSTRWLAAHLFLRNVLQFPSNCILLANPKMQGTRSRRMCYFCYHTGMEARLSVVPGCWRVQHSSVEPGTTGDSQPSGDARLCHAPLDDPPASEADGRSSGAPPPASEVAGRQPSFNALEAAGGQPSWLCFGSGWASIVRAKSSEVYFAVGAVR